MPIKVVCQCGAKFVARDQLAGKDVECVACGASLRVPHAPPQVAAGRSRGVTAALSVMGVALLGCGAMLYLLQDRVKALQSDLAAQQASVSTLRGELDRNAQQDQKTTQEDDARIAQLSTLVEAGAATRKSLADKLDKVDMETVRVRGELQGLEQQRNAALAASEAKRAALDGQLADLRSQLATKASAQETAQIQQQITQVEQAKDRLLADASANQAKIDGWNRDIQRLEGELRAKAADKNEILNELTNAEDKLQQDLKKLETRLTPDPKAKDPKALLAQAAAQAAEAERYRTVVAEQSGVQATLRIDTGTGQTFLAASRPGSWPSLTMPIFEAGAGAMGGPGAGKPGRFDLKVTYDSGAVRDIVRLDTVEGRVWLCDQTTGVMRWVEMPVWAPRGLPGKAERWSLSVSTAGSSGPSTHPVIVLTRSDGTVLDNSLTPNFFVPRLP